LSQEYPWYALVEESEELEQGDFIDDFEVLIPTYIPTETKAGMSDTPKYQTKGISRNYNVVIVSQSCDLDNGKLEYVLMCPRVSYSEYLELYKSSNPKNVVNNLEYIRQGRQHKYCMLNQCNLPSFPSEIQIVDLGTVFSVPYSIIKQMAKSYSKRLRLLSPYKEKLAQAFAYYYMRIALPIDIQSFNKIPVQINAKPAP